MALQQFLDVPGCYDFPGRDLVQGKFPVDDVLVRIMEHPHHVHLLFKLPDHLQNRLQVRVGHNRDSVDPFHCRCTCIEGPDVQTVSCEYVRHLGEDSNLVLGVDDDRVSFYIIFHIYSVIRYSPYHCVSDSIILSTPSPGGIIGITFPSSSTWTTRTRALSSANILSTAPLSSSRHSTVSEAMP